MDYIASPASRVPAPAGRHARGEAGRAADRGRSAAAGRCRPAPENGVRAAGGAPTDIDDARAGWRGRGAGPRGAVPDLRLRMNRGGCSLTRIDSAATKESPYTEDDTYALACTLSRRYPLFPLPPAGLAGRGGLGVVRGRGSAGARRRGVGRRVAGLRAPRRRHHGRALRRRDRRCKRGRPRRTCPCPRSRGDGQDLGVGLGVDRIPGRRPRGGDVHGERRGLVRARRPWNRAGRPGHEEVHRRRALHANLGFAVGDLERIQRGRGDARHDQGNGDDDGCGEREARPEDRALRTCACPGRGSAGDGCVAAGPQASSRGD